MNDWKCMQRLREQYVCGLTVLYMSRVLESITCMHGLIDTRYSLKYDGCYTHKSGTHVCNIAFQQHRVLHMITLTQYD